MAATHALAAAEVVAALAGRPARELPEEVEEAIDGHEPPSPALVTLAVESVQAVRAGSRLRELWSESGEDEWLEHVDDLLVRLTG